MFAIIDIETTGGDPRKDKITEIAVFIHDGEKVIEEYQTLINPQTKIPHFISKMTGITDEMVKHSPRFFEVAKKIVQITEGKIFVAHNVSFDYRFISEEFLKLGFNYQRECLCTVKLSRKVFPGLQSYSLGRLCNSLNINLNNRHRAAGDALATVKLFELIKKSSDNGLLSNGLEKKLAGNFLNPALNFSIIESLPDKTGIYSFFDEKGNLLYIGKSNRIRQRVLSHLREKTKKKAIEMLGRIVGIEYEETGSELIALLKESMLIKEKKPLFNRAQRRSVFTYGIYSYTDKNGYLCLKISKANNNETPIACFASRDKTIDFLSALVNKYSLCQNLCGLYQTSGACFYYAIRICKGACILEESPDDYNIRVKRAIDDISFEGQNLVIIDKGRTKYEKSVVLIQNGKYLGFGFISDNEAVENPEGLLPFITETADNSDVRRIISSYIKNRKVVKTIRF